MTYATILQEYITKYRQIYVIILLVEMAVHKPRGMGCKNQAVWRGIFRSFERKYMILESD